MTKHTTNNPTIKFCECGCGQPSPIAKRNNPKLGHIKGQPARFIVGHHNKVRPLRPVEDRFWEKVDRLGDNECWLWTAGDDGKGYGQLRVDGQALKAHRISYELHYGPIPDGFEVCHDCDNPSCVNPAHLQIGTHKENMHDSISKGRASMPPPNQVEGETNGRAQYTNAQVRDFRNQFPALNISVGKFAQMHNVPLASMWRIIKRRTYKNA